MYGSDAGQHIPSLYTKGLSPLCDTIGKLYTVFIRRESDAALDATAAVQGKQSAAIMSIHDGKHKYHSPK